ncbi:MAG: translation initiation factor IF-3 [Bacilli bacterium]|nr:translation initiation factor IF-3 [Bacilli bacterium]
MEVLHIIYNINQRPVKKDDTPINEEIRAREVLLIGHDGQQFGVKPIREAQSIANREGYDLVMVAPNATPPVCKLMDYKKYRYEQQRKAREAKKNQHIVEIKEIRLTAVIDTHDFETKLRNGIKFLDKGDKLKVAVWLPYRAGEMLIQQGREVLKRFRERCEEVGTLEKDIAREGRYLTMFLSPKKK